MPFTTLARVDVPLPLKTLTGISFAVGRHQVDQPRDHGSVAERRGKLGSIPIQNGGGGLVQNRCGGLIQDQRPLLVQNGGGGLVQNRRGGLIEYGRGGLIDVRHFGAAGNVAREVVSRDQGTGDHQMAGIHPGVEDRNDRARAGGEIVCLSHLDDGDRKLG